MVSDSDKLLWSVKETCAALGIARSKLDQLTAEGSIPTVLIGRRRLFPVEQVKQWIAGLPSENTEGGRYGQQRRSRKGQAF